jgi:hypothetical protein
MLMRPPPMPPCPFLYTADEFAKYQAAYPKDLEIYGRECNRVMWMNAIPIVCACVGVMVLALFGPGVVMSAIEILAR